MYEEIRFNESFEWGITNGFVRGGDKGTQTPRRSL
jgi:hypothetical protein